MGTLRPRVHELSHPQEIPVSGGHNSYRRHGGVLTIDSKDARGPDEHSGPRIKALRPRVYELRPLLDAPVRGGHNPLKRHDGVLTIHSKNATELANTRDHEFERKNTAYMSYALH